jgi:hypothetical protein
MSQTQPLLNPATQALAFLRRVLASDFRSEKPTDWEMHRMGADRATPRLAHSYTAWRSSLLYAAGALLLFTSIWNLATFESSEESVRGIIVGVKQAQVQAQILAIRQQGFQPPQDLVNQMQVSPAQEQTIQDNANVIDSTVLISRISAIPAVLLIIAAGVLWPRVRLSTILARLGWGLLFGVPFVLAILPISAMMDYINLTGEFELLLKGILGLLFAVQVIISLLPKALSLFPALIRSSMALKTLLPESRGPGWITVLLAPLFGLFLWLIMSVVNQFPSTSVLLLGVIFILAGQVIYIFMARHIVRGYSTLPAKVIWTRRMSALLGLAGLLIIFIRLLAYEHLPTGDVIAGFLGIFGNILLLSVVCSDFLLPQLRTSHRMTRNFVQSEMFDTLGSKCEDLAMTVEAQSAGSARAGAAAKPAAPVETVQARAVDEVETVQAKPVEEDEEK